MLVLTLSLFLQGEATAGRAPDRDAAEDLVDQLIDRVLIGDLSESWADRHLHAWLPYSETGEEQTQAERASLLRRLAPGGDLYKGLVRSPTIYGSVEGPDYVRVVLEGGEWLTVVVDAPNGRPQVRAFETSTCGLCREPERYLRDLVAEVQSTGDASHRLLPGIELLTNSVHPDNEWKRERWVWAYVNRAAGSGYTTGVLRNASVLDSAGRMVTLALQTGEETWPLVYLKKRWWVDYAGLPENSVLRMDESESESWTAASTVRAARLSSWRPDWREQEGVVQVSDGALFFEYRDIQEDLLLYDQDMGRRWAMWAVVDEREGRVLAKMDAPRLPRRMFVDTMGWPELFRFSLAPDGQHLAVAAHNRLWVFDLASAEVRLELKDLSGAGGLAFSPDGGQLAVLDRAFGGLRFFETRQFSERSRSRAPAEALQIQWTAEGLWFLTADALSLRVDDGGEEVWSQELACGESAQMSHVAALAETWVYCPGRGVGVLRVPHHAPNDGERIPIHGSRKPGAFAISGDGRWLLVPAKTTQAEGMCLMDLSRSKSTPFCFSTLPLRNASFDAEGRTLTGIDQRGRTWRWQTSTLTGGEGH